MGGPGSGRKKGTGGAKMVGKSETFSLSLSKMKQNPMSNALKKEFKKAGGVNSSAYKKWVKANWV